MRLADAALAGQQRDVAAGDAILHRPVARRHRLAVPGGDVDALEARAAADGASSGGGVPLSVQSGAWSTSALKPSTVPPAATQSDTSPFSARPGQLDDADARRLADERAGHFLRMLVAVLVIVRNDDHVGTGQVLGEFGCHLWAPPALQVAGMPWRASVENVLFALDDDHWPLERHRLEQLGQAVRHLPHAFDAPHPALLHLVWRVVRACPAPLAKGLRLEAADLEQQRAGFVGVVVGRDDLESLRAIVVSRFPVVTANSSVSLNPCCLSHCGISRTPSRLRKSMTPPPSFASWSNQVPLATSTLRAPLLPHRNSFVLEWRGFGSPQKCRATSGMAWASCSVVIARPTFREGS